jgi:hypothetical protein
MRTVFIIAASLFTLTRPATGQAPAPDRATIDYVERLRHSDGGYAPNAMTARSSLRATAAAVRALRYFGAKPATGETGRFVEQCYDKSAGGFADFPGQPPTAALTAVGAMAAVDLGVPAGLYREAAIRYLSEYARSPEEIRIAAAAFEALQRRPPKADDWLRQIGATRNQEGTFGVGRDMARQTGGTAVLILRLGGTIDHRDAVVKTLREGQRPDGGFGSAAREGSDLDSTYRILRAFMMLKERSAAPDELRAFIARCRAASGGYGVTPGEPPSAAGTYYAAAVLHWLDGR